jgi:hypothetical protein
MACIFREDLRNFAWLTQLFFCEEESWARRGGTTSHAPPAADGLHERALAAVPVPATKYPRATALEGARRFFQGKDIFWQKCAFSTQCRCSKEEEGEEGGGRHMFNWIRVRGVTTTTGGDGDGEHASHNIRVFAQVSESSRRSRQSCQSYYLHMHSRLKPSSLFCIVSFIPFLRLTYIPGPAPFHARWRGWTSRPSRRRATCPRASQPEKTPAPAGKELLALFHNVSCKSTPLDGSQASQYGMTAM